MPSLAPTPTNQPLPTAQPPSSHVLHPPLLRQVPDPSLGEHGRLAACLTAPPLSPSLKYPSWPPTHKLPAAHVCGPPTAWHP